MVDNLYIYACREPCSKRYIKIEWLDYYENAVSEVTKDISQESVGNITTTYQQGVRRTLNCTLSKDYLPNKDNCLYIGEKIRVSLGLANTSNIWWFNYGVFLTKSVEKNDDGSYTISAVDKFGIFSGDINQGTLQVTHKIPAGSSVGTLIEDLITIDDGSGKLLDCITPKISMDLYNKLLPQDIEKDSKGHISDILIDFATAYDCDIYYNKMGDLCVSKQNLDEYNQLAPSWIFDENDSSLFSYTESYDYASVVNTITVSSDTSSKVLYQYTAINDYPMSPFCVSKIGTRIDDDAIVESSMVISDKTAEDYANYLLNKKLRQSFLANIECGYLPHLDVDDVVVCNGVSLISNEISIPLGNGNMSISATSLDYLKTTENCSNYVESTNDANWTYSVDNDIYSLTSYIGTESNVTTPATYNGEEITILGNGSNSVFQNSNANVTGITVSDNITNISSNAFYSCSSLTSAILSGNITSIGDSAFYNCSSLESIEIPQLVTGISASTFANCTSLGNVTLQNGVKFIGTYAFSSCSALTSIILPNTLVGIYDYAFKQSGLTSITIPNSVTSISSYAFSQCSSLTTATILANITSIPKYCFNNCPSLTSVTLPNTITEIKTAAFYGCSGLTSITIPSTVTTIGAAAFRGTNLTSVTISSSCTVGTNAFPSTCTINYY